MRMVWLADPADVVLYKAYLSKNNLPDDIATVLITDSAGVDVDTLYYSRSIDDLLDTYKSYSAYIEDNVEESI